MATPLSVYLSQTVATTITGGDQLWANTTGGTAGSKNTTIGTLTGWGELVSQGAGTFQGAGSIGTPTGHGWILELATLSLESQQIIAGTWSGAIRSSISAGTVTGDWHVRAFKRSVGGVYTQMGSDLIASAVTVTTTAATISLPNTSLPVTNFNAGDKLYIDVWFNCTSNSSSAGATLRIFSTTSATLGSIQAVVATPGYQAQSGSMIKYQRPRIGRILP